MIWAKRISVHVGFPRSQALPLFTLYLRTWQTALETMCVQMPQGLGDQLKRIAHKY